MTERNDARFTGLDLLKDPLREYPGYALRRASAATIAGLAHRLSVLRLRPSEASVLLVIEANPGITQSDIGRMLDIASANMAPLAARLFDRELIVRERVDGRSHGIKLSPQGCRITKRVARTVANHEAALLARIPPELRQTFVEALHCLWRAEQG